MADNKDELISEHIFNGFCKNEIMDWEALPPHIQTLIKKSFHAGMITTFNHSEPLLESMMIGKNAEIVKKSKGDDPIRIVMMKCETEMEAKKTRSDFQLYQEAHNKYTTLIDESRDFARSQLKSGRDSKKRQAEKEENRNVFNFGKSPKVTH